MFSTKELFEVLNLHAFVDILPLELERYSLLLTYRKSLKKIPQMRCKNLKSQLMSDIKSYKFLLGNNISKSNPDYDSFPLKQSASIDKDLVDWYKKFLLLAKENEIKILQFNAPLSNIVYSIREKNGFNKTYLDSMEKLRQEFDNLEFLYPLISYYSDDLFSDLSHLDIKGAEIFNKDLLKILPSHILTSRPR